MKSRRNKGKKAKSPMRTVQATKQKTSKQKKKKQPISRKKFTKTNSTSPIEENTNVVRINEEVQQPKLRSKFLNCPLCNGLIRNFNDLTIHLKEAHAVSEQLIQNVLEKFDSHSDKDEASGQQQGQSVDIDDDDCVNNGLMIYDKTIYGHELELIKEYLELEDLDETKFIEFDFIIGDCYLCNEKIEDNLLIHLNDKHDLNLKSALEENCCLICGERLSNQKSFIKHQFNLHNVVSIISLNKLFKVQLDRFCGDESMNSSKKSILSNLNISDKMRERVHHIKSQKKVEQVCEYDAVKKPIYENETGKDRTKFSLASFAAEYINNKLDPLYDPESLPHQFSVSLMLKLFRYDELINHSVFKRVESETGNHHYSKDYKGALDEERVNFIRDIVFKRYSPLDKEQCWAKCAKAMLNKIYALKPRVYSEKELEEFETERSFIYKLVTTPVNSPEMKKLLEDYIVTLDKDINPNEQSSFNYLNKTDLKRIFDSCDTAFHFATGLMIKLFKVEELDASANVYGRIFKKDAIIKKPLDQKRIAYIRLQTFKHFDALNQRACWSKCVKTMNEKIRNLQRRAFTPNSSLVIDSQDEEDDNDDEEEDEQNDIDEDDLTEDNQEIDLSKIDINRIYEETRSAPNFCVQLMLKVFKKSELYNHNVYGRIFKPTTNSKDALDENRVDFLREKMLSYYPTQEKKKLWARCVKAMNDKICYLQKTNRLTAPILKIEDEDADEQQQRQQQQQEQQDDTSFRDKITQEDINYLYRSTISPQNFAVRLMLKCFDCMELSRNKNVYGRVYKRDIKQKRALDESRIDFIRETVFKYYPEEVKRACWPKCIKSMNDKIRYINSK